MTTRTMLACMIVPTANRGFRLDLEWGKYCHALIVSTRLPLWMRLFVLVSLRDVEPQPICIQVELILSACLL